LSSFFLSWFSSKSKTFADFVEAKQVCFRRSPHDFGMTSMVSVVGSVCFVSIDGHSLPGWFALLTSCLALSARLFQRTCGKPARIPLSVVSVRGTAGRRRRAKVG
jgi:hypothetical protein